MNTEKIIKSGLEHLKRGTLHELFSLQCWYNFSLSSMDRLTFGHVSLKIKAILI